MATNKQLAQQARQSRECRRRPLLPQGSNRQLTQRARQDRERQVGAHQLPIARRSLLPQPADTVLLHYRIGRYDVASRLCDHWVEERV